MKNNSITLFLVFLFAVFFTLACNKDEEENPDVMTIRYTLTSEEAGKSADIEYTSIRGVVMTLEDEPLPWSASFNAILKVGDALSFTAESGDQGEMTARILLDDESVATKTGTYMVQLDYIRGLK
jgi:hypothetical protein